jgi:hypothetical protein
VVELLLSLIFSLTGIDRTVDSELTTIAEQRVVQIQTSFSHDGQFAGTAEVLAWNSGYTYEMGVERLAYQWMGSPNHWDILTDPSHTEIGCAVDRVDDKTFGVCVFWVEQTPVPVEPAPTPAIELLPNTQMGDSTLNTKTLLVVIALLLAVASFIVSEYPLVTVAVILLCITALVGDTTIT